MLLSAVLLLALGLDSPGPAPRPMFFDPYEVVSPSGDLVVYVEPTDRFGGGPATYRFEDKDDVASVEVRLGFTLHEAEVTDDGVLVGYGLDGPVRDAGTRFVVAAIGSNGEVLWMHRRPLVWRRAAWIPEPEVLDMAVQHETGRMVLLARATASGEPTYRSPLRAWSYRIADGACTDVRSALVGRPLDDPFERVEALDAIPGSPLLLVTASRRERVERRWTTLVVLRLVDVDGSAVWETSWSEPAAKVAGSNRMTWGLHRPHVFHVDRGGFDAWCVSRRTRVRFDLRRAASGEWTVDEGEPAPIDLPSWSADPDLLPPPIELERISKHALEGVQPGGPTQFDEFLWRPLPGGGRTVLRFRWSGPAPGVESVDLLTCGPEGRVEHEVRLDALPNGDIPSITSGWEHCDALGWCLFGSPSGALVVDADSGGLVRRDAWSAANDADGRVGLAPDGSLAWLERPRRGDTRVHVIGPHADPAWERTLKPETAERIGSVQSVVWIDPDHVAIVCHNDDLWLIPSSGDLRGPWNLEERIGNGFWLSGPVRRSAAGDMLVESLDDARLFAVLRPCTTVEDSPPFRVVRFFTPHFADGSLASSFPDSTRLDHAGAAWAFDGAQFYPMDERGMVTGRVGTPRRLDVLHDHGSSGILEHHVAIRDVRSGAVHVWTHRGERAFVAERVLRDADREYTQGPIRNGPDGSIWVGPFDDEIRCWSADGTRGPTIEAEWLAGFVPTTRGIWTWTSDGVPELLVDGKVRARLERSIGGRWIRSLGDICELPGGDLIVAHGRNRGRLPGGGSLPPAVEFVRYERRGNDYVPISATEFPCSAYRVRVNGDWLVAVRHGGVLLQRQSTGDWFSFSHGAGDDVFASPTADGTELVVFSPYEYEITRWRLPD